MPTSAYAMPGNRKRWNYKTPYEGNRGLPSISTTQNTAPKFLFMVEENLTSYSAYSFGYSSREKKAM